MALHASTLSPPPKFPIKLFGQQQRYQVQRSLVLGTRYRTSSKCALKVSMSQFEFGGPDKVKLQIDVVKEKLQKAIPDSVKELEWEKGANIVVEQLLSLGKKALKWSIVVLFVLSSVSDVIFSISRNQELVMPFGLLVGCLVADFLKETFQEVFQNSQGEEGLKRNLIGIGCFFALIKFVSACFGLRGKVFLLHVANGGFLQVLWLWRSLPRGKDESNQDESLSVEHDSLAVEGKD